jgi:hypothetical protein
MAEACRCRKGSGGDGPDVEGFQPFSSRGLKQRPDLLEVQGPTGLRSFRYHAWRGNPSGGGGEGWSAR